MASYSKKDLEDFFDGYVWSAVTIDGVQRYGLVSDLAPEVEDRMVADCKRFLDIAAPMVKEGTSRHPDVRVVDEAGIVFYAVRNGIYPSTFERSVEGVSWPQWKKLNALAHKFGPTPSLVMRSGRIYEERPRRRMARR